MSLLVTAFGRFDDGPNCSEALLQRLAAESDALRDLWGAPVAFAILPVCTDGVEAALRRLVGEARPTHVLLTGQAAGRARICFERVARNRRNLLIPDDSGRIGALGPVRLGGPEERRATWPGLEASAHAAREAGIRATVSDDAGWHLCNQTLYLALEMAESADPPFVATFLHLPLTPEQVEARIPAALRRPTFSSLPLDEMARAVRLFLVHTRRAPA